MSKIVEFRSPAGALLRQVAECGHEKPWFIAKDVCEALGLTHVTNALRPLEPDEKGCKTITTPGGPQEMAIVSEPGLYSLIGRSRKPEAKAFKRWVNHEVLPSIRRTGSYSATSNASDDRFDRLLTVFQQHITKTDERFAVLADRLERGLATSFATARPYEIAGLKRRLGSAADCAVLAKAYKSRRSALSALHKRMRTACGWDGTGSRLELMPVQSLPFAEREVAAMEREYSRFENVHQLPLRGTS